MTLIIEGLKTMAGVIRPSARRLALMEGPTNCNRNCAICTVPARWDILKASTRAETFGQIDTLVENGYGFFNYVGGEPTHPTFTTKERIPFAKHTEDIISYAHQKGMYTSITTNGDYVNTEILRKLRNAGLDALNFSLHTLTNQGLEHILRGAKMTAQVGIPPIVNVVYTADLTDKIPGIAAMCAENGIFFSTTIVQEYGGGFSAVPEQSQIPSVRQQRQVFESLIPLKRAGFIIDSERYLKHAPDFPGNSWKCDPDKDAFIHIKAIGQGEIGVCSEVPTPFKVGEVNLKDRAWREKKKELVANCNNCLYLCTFQAENSDLVGSLKTLFMMALIKTGRADLVKLSGQHTVQRLRRRYEEFNESVIPSKSEVAKENSGGIFKVPVFVNRIPVNPYSKDVLKPNATVPIVKQEIKKRRLLGPIINDYHLIGDTLLAAALTPWIAGSLVNLSKMQSVELTLAATGGTALLSFITKKLYRWIGIYLQEIEVERDKIQG